MHVLSVGKIGITTGRIIYQEENGMKKIIALLLTVICVLSCIRSTKAETDPVGCMLDKMSTVDFDGNAVTGEIFSQYKLTFLNYWVTWCKPCIDEFPHIQAVSVNAEYAERGLNVLGLLLEDSDSTLAKAKDYLKKNACTYTNLRAGEDEQIAELKSKSGSSLPVSYLINSDGMVISYHVGGMNLKQIKDFIEEGFRIIENPQPTEDPEIIKGDVNGDKTVNTGDATVVLKYSAGMVDLDEMQLIAGDVNRDDNVNTGDATQILKFAAGMITEF